MSSKQMKKTGRILAGILATTLLTGCSGLPGGDSVRLDPDDPVSITVWHYYNGAQQAAFDALLTEFNATVGQEKGIYVEAGSKGSVADLEQAVADAVAEKVGAEALPDIFSTYSDTAYTVQKEGKLVDLTKYFSKEELSQYVDDYVREGYIDDDDALYLFPVAKSTEVMMINVTDWEPFAKASGSTLEDLSTIEGVVDVAERYYHWTDEQTPDIPNDGKAFYGRDSMSNYFIIGMRQMGTEIFDVQDGKVNIQTDKEKLRRLWDNYYVPYMKGYFAQMGKFRSDDVKTGDILAYTGSSSSAAYFPDVVMDKEEGREIDFAVLPAPIMKDGEKINVQQGAGMAVTKSDERHEYAACEFLKWFTGRENNLLFACESSYMPVRKDANTLEALDEMVAGQKVTVESKNYECLKSILSEFDAIDFYCTKCFENGYQTRKVLDYHLSDKAVQDREAVKQAIASGEDRESVLAQYLSDDAFEQWYGDFTDALTQASK